MMNEVNDLAGQHELIAENLTAEVFREVTMLIRDFKDERKKVYFDFPYIILSLVEVVGRIHPRPRLGGIMNTECRLMWKQIFPFWYLVFLNNSNLYTNCEVNVLFS